MKTLLAVLAALALGASCAEKAEPLKTYYRARVMLEDRSVLTYELDPKLAPAFLSGWRAEGREAWLEVSTDSGWTWEQATDDGKQTTFTVEEKP